jgi:hypothetical protein
MKLIKILISLAIGFLLINCEDKNGNIGLSNGEYLIFGHFYGECLGEECTEIFKLTSNKLFEDIADNYPRQSEFYNGNYVEVENSSYELINDLFDYFPKDLLNENNTVFGCPDCVDQGGLYIEYNEDGIRKYWIIDQSIESIPTYLHEFISKVNEYIDLINT